MKPIVYFMKNRINGKEVTLEGSGTLDDDGVMNMDVLVSDVPLGWSPILAPCICSGPGPGPVKNGRMKAGGLLKYAPNGYRTSPGKLRRALLVDSKGNSLAVVNATGVYSQDKSGLNFEIDVDTQVKEKSIITSLTGIDHYSFTIEPINFSQVKVYAHYSLSTKSGEKVYGWTQIFYDLIDTRDSVPYSIVGCNAIDIAFKDGHLRYTSTQMTRPEQMLGNVEAISQKA